MQRNQLDNLIDEIKERPVTYAAVALAFTAAVVLTSRSTRDNRSTVQKLTDRGTDALRYGSKEARNLVPDVDALSSAGDRVSKIASQAGISQSTAAVFLGTVLSKAFTGYLKRQDAIKARSQGASLSEASGKDLGDRLNEMTVAELRQIAAERNVAGRSTMKKNELLDALEK